LHLFEVPFYYVEYGIAQIGALGVWKNYRENSVKAIEDYKSALKLGYSTSIPSIYKTAGLTFDFSENTLKDLGQFVSKELEKY
jgi:oligoendopeptidase F